MPEQLRALVLISAWAALRFGEATELRRRDVDGNVLHISRSVVRLPGEHIVGTPKSAVGVRSVTMPPQILEAVAGHLAAMGDKRPDAGSGTPRRKRPCATSTPPRGETLR